MVASLILFAGIVGLLLVGTRLPVGRLQRLVSLPDHRLAPAVAGIVTGVAVWYAWGSLHAPTPVHDEAAYLLQARTFASFHWAMPSPPLPEFFEQYHVFVTPTFASKYPPGHALMLVPGIWLSLPGLVPVLFSSLAGALLFLLVRRTTNAWVAALTIALWLPTRDNLRFRGSYMSENTSSLLWLLGWWALLEWRRNHSNRWLVVIAGCVGWMGITRPFTAVAYAIPVAAVVLYDVARRHEWRQLLRPMLLGVAILGIVPIWNAETLGDWRKAPVKVYSEIYFPYDDIGFHVNDAKPQRPLPPDMQRFAKDFREVHVTHTTDRMGRIFADRWIAIGREMFHGWRVSLLLFGILGLVLLGRAGWFAAGTAFLLTAVYLVFAHPLDWTIYYVEIFPLLPFLTALGIGAVATRLVRPKAAFGWASAREWGPRQALGAAMLLLVLLVPGVRDAHYARRYEFSTQSYHLLFRELIARIPDDRAIVFVRYSPRHISNISFIANGPDIAHAHLWVVYDRGAENAKLAALAPERATYLFDEATFSLRPTQYELARK
jgi:hypothetical protein